MRDVAEIPPRYVGVAGTIKQLGAAEAVLGILRQTSWLALRPSRTGDAVIVLLYRAAEAALGSARPLPGGAAVLAPGTRIEVMGDGLRASIPGGQEMLLSVAGARWLPAAEPARNGR